MEEIMRRDAEMNLAGVPAGVPPGEAGAEVFLRSSHPVHSPCPHVTLLAADGSASA